MDVNYTAGGHTKIGWLKIERRGGERGEGGGVRILYFFANLMNG